MTEKYVDTICETYKFWPNEAGLKQWEQLKQEIAGLNGKKPSNELMDKVYNLFIDMIGYTDMKTFFFPQETDNFHALADMIDFLRKNKSVYTLFNPKNIKKRLYIKEFGDLFSNPYIAVNELITFEIKIARYKDTEMAKAIFALYGSDRMYIYECKSEMEGLINRYAKTQDAKLRNLLILAEDRFARENKYYKRKFMVNQPQNTGKKDQKTR